ncbi:MAG: zinc finger domain-containing protein [Symbiobacteriia bacterium]
MEFRCSECRRLLAKVQSGTFTVKCPKCGTLNTRNQAPRWKTYTPQELEEIAGVDVEKCPEGKERDWFAVLFSAWSQPGLSPELNDTLEKQVMRLTDLAWVRGSKLEDAPLGTGAIENWRGVLAA